MVITAYEKGRERLFDSLASNIHLPVNKNGGHRQQGGAAEESMP